MADHAGATVRPVRASGAVLTLDNGGAVLAWSEGAQDLLGHRADDVVGHAVDTLLTTRGSAELSGWSVRARPRRSWSGTAEFRRGDGRNADLAVRITPLSDGGRGDAGWIVTVDLIRGSAGEAVDAAAPESASLPPVPEPADLLHQSPIALSLFDRDGRRVWLNEAAGRMDAAMGVDRPGRRAAEVFPGPEGRALEALVQGVFDSGEPVIDREYRCTLPDGGELVLAGTFFRVEGPNGEPVGVCSTATDVTDSRIRQHFLQVSEASRHIGTALDVQRTAQELADAAVPLLADYVTVDLADWVSLGEEPAEPIGASDTDSADPRIPVFRRAGIASIHAGLPEALWQIGEVVVVPPDSPFTRALLSGLTHFEPVLDTSPGTWLDQDPQRARTIKATGMHSLIIVPLKARGMVLGEAVFVRTDNPLPFSREDLLLIEQFVERAALSLDNARRYSRERAASLTLQRSLLPGKISGGAALEVASRYLPADTRKGVGGDWFDVVPLSEGRVALVIGDVVGHGISAAARMGQYRTVVQTLADLDPPPEELLARLDRLVLRLSDQDTGGDSSFAASAMGGTCLYAVYDPATRGCTMASAGHPPPAVRNPDGSIGFVDLPVGPPIGLGTMAYRSVTVDLPAGSTIALYTDGLIETRTADIDTGMDRLRTALAGPSLPLEQFCQRVVTAMAPYGMGSAERGPAAAFPDAFRTKPSPDDVTLLVARTRA
ncbi:PAS domain S-box-containing protein [Streptomyces sp. DvalAA-14]|uniref:SpoIIE family protein phosphatase n=1 Tax=unclassified Streptomyces TaxID=2593676 RepID=UPI00081B4FF0|nr:MULTISPECIES: SpoIIE family protein phosphatase [unclassified Streptomyces]MYS23324.1 SpoIIE family protein phosphatase [Streptomyces sp. SID4948]SCE31533.1 PAS domain S-box-containing protein [Streptomyces sp. DvalAA-14]